MAKTTCRLFCFSSFLIIFSTTLLSVISPVSTAYSAGNTKSGKSKDDVSSKSWRGFVIDTQRDGTIWINVGRINGVMAGFRFEVIVGEKTVKDPSGKTYTIPGKRKATLEVVNTLDKISSVKILKGRKVKKGDVVRFISGGKGKAATRAGAAPEPSGKGESEGFFQEGIIVDVNTQKRTGIISIGRKNSLKRGDKLVAVRAKEEITDPRTGEIIRVNQEYAGVMEVISVGDSVSNVKFIKNAKDIHQGDGVRRHTSAPSGVTASPAGFRKIGISWKLQAEPEIRKYYIYRSQTADGKFNKVGEVKKAGIVSFMDKHSKKISMGDSTTYFYKVSAINIIDQESPKSETSSVQTLGPPNPPSGLTAESGFIRSAPLRWDIHDNEELAGYRIYRSENKNDLSRLIADIKGRKVVKYDDRNGGSKSAPKLNDSTAYYYSISGYSPYGDEGVKSEPVRATTSVPPAIPSGFEGKGWQANKVPLEWGVHSDDNVRGYIIYRAEEEEGPFQQIKDIKDRKKTSYVDGGESGIFSTKKKLASSRLYFYRIQAYNWVKSKSEMSEVISVMTRPVPAAPENLKSSENRPREIPISWRKNPDVKIKSYQIYRSEAQNGVFKKIKEVPADKSYFLDQKLKDNKTYYYKIRAIDKDKLDGDFTEVTSATTKMPPETVNGLTWVMEGNKSLLKWDKNKEIDIEEYIIWRKGLFGWTKEGSSKINVFKIKRLKQGSSENYAVSAKDADNIEGKRSDPLLVQMP